LRLRKHKKARVLEKIGSAISRVIKAIAFGLYSVEGFRPCTLQTVCSHNLLISTTVSPTYQHTFICFGCILFVIYLTIYNKRLVKVRRNVING
jgi:hypothetical protein